MRPMRPTLSATRTRTRIPLGRSIGTRLRYTTGVSPPSPSHGHDPLRPSVAVSELGLPLTPLPAPIPSIPRTDITRSTLVRLCQMSALNPPPEGSEEESKLLQDLGELVGLMDLVGEVQVEGEVGDLLQEGMGEVVFKAGSKGDKKSKVDEIAESRLGDGDAERLLEFATRRVGEYYGFRNEKK